MQIRVPNSPRPPSSAISFLQREGNYSLAAIQPEFFVGSDTCGVEVLKNVFTGGELDVSLVHGYDLFVEPRVVDLTLDYVEASKINI